MSKTTRRGPRQSGAPRRADRRSRLSPLVATAAFAVILAGGIGYREHYAGSASDGDPQVSLKLGNYAQSGDGGPRRVTFLGVRSLNGNLVADSALLEDSAQGPLPIVARDGRAPFTAYARVFDRKDKRPS